MHYITALSFRRLLAWDQLLTYSSVLLPVLFLFSAISALNSQPSYTPYELRSGITIPLWSTGLGLSAGSYFLNREVKLFTEEDLPLFNIDVIPPIDRYATRHFSATAHQVSNFTALTALVAPLALTIDKRGRDHFNQIGVITLGGAFVTAGLMNITKVLVKRPRPYVFNPEVPNAYRFKRKAQYSFFSGHTAMAAYFSFTAAKLHHDFYPQSELRPVFWASAAILPALTGYYRMRAGRHYFTDVLTGYLIGAAVGILVPQLYKQKL